MPGRRRAIAALLLAVGAAALLPHHGSRPKCIRRASAENDAADANDADDDEATLFSKRKAAEIKIPVEVYDTTPPQNLVGVCLLYTSPSPRDRG